ncbi:MAG: hypothetical protein AAF356_04415 [Planctomycetota bacterium]
MLDRDKRLLIGTASFVFGASCGLLLVVATRRVFSGDSSLLIQLAMAIVGTGTVGLMVAVVTDFLTTVQARRMQEASNRSARHHLRLQALHTKQMDVSAEIFKDIMEMHFRAQQYARARIEGVEDRIKETHDAFDLIHQSMRLGFFHRTAVLSSATREIFYSVIKPVEAVASSTEGVDRRLQNERFDSAVEHATQKVLELEGHLVELWGTKLDDRD